MVEILIIGIVISVTIEVLQWLGAQRVADVDDVLLNTLGTILGYLWYAIMQTHSQKQ